MEQFGPLCAAQTAREDILQMLWALRPPTQPLRPSATSSLVQVADTNAAARQQVTAAHQPASAPSSLFKDISLQFTEGE